MLLSSNTDPFVWKVYVYLVERNVIVFITVLFSLSWKDEISISMEKQSHLAIDGKTFEQICMELPDEIEKVSFAFDILKLIDSYCTIHSYTSNDYLHQNIAASGNSLQFHSIQNMQNEWFSLQLFMLLTDDILISYRLHSVDQKCIIRSQYKINLL